MMKDLMKIGVSILYLSTLPVMAGDTGSKPLYSEEEFKNFILQKRAMEAVGTPKDIGGEVQKKSIESSNEFSFTCPHIWDIMAQDRIQHMGIDFEIKEIQQGEEIGSGIVFNNGKNPVECRYEEFVAIPKFKHPDGLSCGYYTWSKDRFKTENLMTEYASDEISNDVITCIRQ